MAGVHGGPVTPHTMAESAAVMTCDRGHVPAPVCMASTSSVDSVTVIMRCVVPQLGRRVERSPNPAMLFRYPRPADFRRHQ